MNNEDLYKKYEHIMKDSIEDIPKGTVIFCSKNESITSHGKICIIVCSEAEKTKECLKTRIINVQDARQVSMCRLCHKKMKNAKRRAKRKTKIDALQNIEQAVR